MNNNRSHNNNIINTQSENYIYSKFELMKKDKYNKKINLYSDNEINNMNYKDAINKDKRSFLQYYISLLRTKHILIFSFYTKNDYNSRLIKIILFIFSCALLYSVNSLFFQDSTMHKIYEDQGMFNLNYQLPQIIYSTLISSIILLLVKHLALTEKQIIQIKATKNSGSIKKLLLCVKIKLIIFFPLTFLFLVLFWYYLSCFGAVYKSTQIHLLKDTLASFGISLIIPFGIYLLPGLFRIPSLSKRKNKRECLYNFSKILQLL